MFTKHVYAAGAFAFLAGVNAHMVMNTPTPYGFSSLQSSPLNGEGYNFPCQSGSRTDAFDAEGVSNPMVVGQDNPLKFTGSAVHGGGSCQISVTYEYPPPADKSKWKVIHSFIGGCPAHATGNIAGAGSDANGRPDGVKCTSDDQTDCLRPFQFQLPEGLKNGNATLAWTWFNKIGNREMYMNCAPISISGGSDDDTLFNSLPEIFVANIPGECKTADQGGVIGFPNPGAYVTNGEAITPGAEGACPAGSASGSSSSSSSAAASSTVAASSSYAAPSTVVASSYAAFNTVTASTHAASSYAATSSGSDSPVLTFSAEQNVKTSAAASDVETSTVHTTTMLTVTDYAPSSAASVVATSTASSSVAHVVPTAASTGSQGSKGNTTCEDGRVSCPTPGAIICLGETQFGLCNIDYCAFPEALATGTTCSSGVIGKRDVVRRESRMHRHAAGHLRRRRSF